MQILYFKAYNHQSFFPKNKGDLENYLKMKFSFGFANLIFYGVKPFSSLSSIKYILLLSLFKYHYDISNTNYFII